MSRAAAKPDGEEGQLGSGDAGGCGEVLDSEVGGGEAEVAEDDAKWDRVVRQAASMAKAVGQLPGHIAREIERANNPPRDWRDELREFAEQGALRIETWNRPNRRFIGRGLVLPSTQKDGVNKAAFMIDTSGSCDAIALACVQNEAQAMLDDGDHRSYRRGVRRHAGHPRGRVLDRRRDRVRSAWAAAAPTWSRCSTTSLRARRRLVDRLLHRLGILQVLRCRTCMPRFSGRFTVTRSA